MRIPETTDCGTSNEVVADHVFATATVTSAQNDFGTDVAFVGNVSG